MKKIITMVSAIMMVANMNAQSISNEKNDSLFENTLPEVEVSADEIAETEAFTKALLNVPARVRFVEGDKYGVHMASDDDVALKCISCNVENGTLSVNFKNDSMKDSFNDVSVVITVVTPKMPTVKTSSDYTLAQR